jgi:hypothetical protein
VANTRKMIKRLLTLIFVALSIPGFSQILVSYDFTGYNGLVQSIPSGWTISNNDSTSGSSQTYYSSTGSCGVSCPSYKFNQTGATIITPTFSNATQLQFFMKGNGTLHQNPFNVYTTTDGVNWTMLQTYNPVSNSGSTYTLNLNSNDVQVKFEYIKDSAGYNVAIDDIIISNGPVGINQLSKENPLLVYPTISTGLLNIESSSERKIMEISVINMIGKEVKRLNFIQNNGKTVLNLTELPDGVYVLKINMNGQMLTKRVVIRH